MFLLISVHFLRRTRMADRHADTGAQPARENFIESMVNIRGVDGAQSEPPEWLPMLDDLVRIRF